MNTGEKVISEYNYECVLFVKLLVQIFDVEQRDKVRKYEEMTQNERLCFFNPCTFHLSYKDSNTNFPNISGVSWSL